MAPGEVEERVSARTTAVGCGGPR